MFRRTAPSQMDAFSGYEAFLGPSRRKKLNDPEAWHNVFFEHLLSKIDEDRFGPLFHGSLGRPNASIRMLVGMMFLKEGFGWSDAELFDHCNFNILAMRALGLTNLDEDVPVPSTYYLFRKQLFGYQTQHSVDLIGEVYDEVTRDQAKQFGVYADLIRMDSKLFGSNIATCCRLQLIVGCLRVFWKSLTSAQRTRARKGDRAELDELVKQQPHQVVYRLKEDEKAAKLRELGRLIARLLKVYEDSTSDRCGPLKRVFTEHYTVAGKKPSLKPPKEISSASLQSPHDLDAAYATKPGQKVKGYKVNVTETCNPEGLNLITDVQVDPACKGDNRFVVPAIQTTESRVGSVCEASMDGAYHSQDNVTFQQDRMFHYTGMQGYPGRFTYRRTKTGFDVVDTTTGAVKRATEYKPEKYRVTFDKHHYFTTQAIQADERRKQIAEMPEEVRKRRNNVEATLFHLTCKLTRTKSRYRGLRPNRLWAIGRAVWVNLVRIQHHLTGRRLAAATS